MMMAPPFRVCAIIFFCLLFIDTNAQFVPVKQSVQKTNNLITKVFGAETILEPLSENPNYQVIKQEGNVLGYACIEEAPSKHDNFEFAVIYDKDLNILEVKVLLYREDYGYEIKSKRWLKQFSSREVKKVQAISGATISVNSLKRAVQQLNQKMRKSIFK